MSVHLWCACYVCLYTCGAQRVHICMHMHVVFKWYMLCMQVCVYVSKWCTVCACAFLLCLSGMQVASGYFVYMTLLCVHVYNVCMHVDTSSVKNVVSVCASMCHI